ncbi:MAG TPA: gliding motility lipoprotein GldH [Crocinitomix sp.]|nr:gliding motility lipoprotein GldH [Crocinitomix sp.]
MKKRVNQIIFGVFFLVNIIACDSDVIYSEFQPVENNVWTYEDAKVFSFDMTEDTVPVKIFINLRTTTDYPYSNIFMYLYSYFPNGYKDKDTLEFFLAKPNGEWLGEVSGTVIENTALITKGYLIDKGKYTFKLEQAMYEDSLPEILDLGITVKHLDIEK